MLGRKGKMWAEKLKNENGRELKTKEEIETAFRLRLERIFNIREEENEEFCEETEREVERWIIEIREILRPKDVVQYVDTPEINPEPILDILKDFKNKAPGPSGITRDFLLKAHFNVHKVYAEIYSACLATGYLPKIFKEAKIVMVPTAGKSPTQIENYRPISLLEVPAKIAQ